MYTKRDCLRVSRLSDLSTFFYLYCSKSCTVPTPCICPCHFPSLIPPSPPFTCSAIRKFSSFRPLCIFANTVPCAENIYAWQTLTHPPRPSSRPSSRPSKTSWSYLLQEALLAHLKTPTALWAYLYEDTSHSMSLFFFIHSCFIYPSNVPEKLLRSLPLG